MRFWIGLIITFGIFIGSAFLGLVSSVNKEGSDDMYFVGWVTTTIGFGVCLTMLLYQNGIIN